MRTPEPGRRRIVLAGPQLKAVLLALRCALADLEGIMPEFEPSGDRQHPAWTTIQELRAAIAIFEKAGF
jgi:2-iminoacetate synthase ThiH